MKKGGNQVILETFSPGSLYEPGLKLLAPGRLREATWKPISPGSCPNRD